MLAQHAALLTEVGQGFASLALLGVAGLALAAYVIFIVAAFISALLSTYSIGMKLVWTVFICCAPFLGALCWFFIGRGNAPVRWA